MADKCFVLMPFKDPFNSYYKQIIAPAIDAAGFAPLRADEIYGTSSIIEDIFKEIRGAAALVADVTGKNPNVNYELGIAHTLGRPVVIISQSIDDIPFDYRHLRAIIYNTTEPDWASKLKDKITHTLQKIEPKTVISNLIPIVSGITGHLQINLEERLKTLESLELVGYWLKDVLHNVRKPISQAVIRGANVRMLAVDVTSLAGQLMRQHSRRAPLLMPEAITGFEHIKDIHELIQKREQELLAASEPVGNGKLEVKLTSWIPSCNIILIDAKKDSGIAKIGINTLTFLSPKTDRRSLILSRKDSPLELDYFCEQFKIIWESSKDCSYSELQDLIDRCKTKSEMMA